MTVNGINQSKGKVTTLADLRKANAKAKARGKDTGNANVTNSKNDASGKNSVFETKKPTENVTNPVTPNGSSTPVGTPASTPEAVPTSTPTSTPTGTPASAPANEKGFFSKISEKFAKAKEAIKNKFKGSKPKVDNATTKGASKAGEVANNAGKKITSLFKGKGGKIGLAIAVVAAVVGGVVWAYNKLSGNQKSTETAANAATEDKKEATTEDKKAAATEDKKQPAATEDKKAAATEDKKQPAATDKDKSKAAVATGAAAGVATGAAAEEKKVTAEEDKKATGAAAEDKKVATEENKKAAATEDKKATEPEKDKKEEPSKNEHIVVKGDNVWNIAKQHLKDMKNDPNYKPSNAEIAKHTRELIELNRLKYEPDGYVVIIRPDDVLKLA
jgi:hypothetical protein